MNWTNFLLTLIVVYVIYYVLNILFDLLRSKQVSTDSPGQEELTFYEESQPEAIYADGPLKEEIEPSTAKSRQAISSGLLQSTGGVNLKQLFSLAQSDLIEYTKAIPY